MQFSVMTWASSSTMKDSIFGILDKDRPGTLPIVSQGGHWEQFRNLDESEFKFAAEAKRSIAENGFYLVGISVTIADAFWP